MKQKTFYITTPIYYPSGDLHIGHLYTTTIAWVIKNYKKMMGYDVKFLTGSDEHGQKIAKKAAELKMSEQDYVDMQVEKFVQLWKKAKIDYDYFSRTTSPKHKQIVKNVFNKMLEKGYIYKGEYTGLYSINDEEFLTQTQAKFENGKYYHPLSGHELQEISEESYFFKMDLFEKWWKEEIEPKNDFIIPKKILNELAKNFVDKGLEQLSVTRISFNWGIKIDQDPKHVIYVWLDALFNYLTALNYSLENDQDYQKYWVNGDEIVHIVGKEIARFHCIYWPTMLKSLDIKLPTKIITHGWLITPEGKMSKSKGNVINPLELLEKFHPEIIKFYLVAVINFSNDGIFDEKQLVEVYNNKLANNYGNLISRTVAMFQQSFSKPVKYFPEKFTVLEKDIFEKITEKSAEYKARFDDFEIDKAIATAMSLSSELNNYIDLSQPWKLKENLERLEVVLNTLINGIYAVSVMLSPILHEKTQQVVQQLKINLAWDQILNFEKFDNVILEKADALFQRIK
ncbi:methionine--tRNA ligase [Mycoplasma iguanae]|uniref:Methionine--tRNA ligase n=1 Tax=Mycoplasma iguanae TaxID=292461 RepID=A0ABY5RB23_9MOLU|nr:methionine--tRNA ligase [Mycoplasma iguanae]UVD81952.1 methionine--tRNA ligase [Mycoplasma iguanae]